MKPITLALFLLAPLCGRAAPVTYNFESLPGALVPMYGTFTTEDADGSGFTNYYYDQPRNIFTGFHIYLPTLSTFPDHEMQILHAGTDVTYYFSTNTLEGWIEGRWRTTQEQRDAGLENWGWWESIHVSDMIVTQVQSAQVLSVAQVPDAGTTAFLLAIGLGCIAVVYRRAGPSVLDRVTARVLAWL